MIYLLLFWEFFKTGLFAVGGGLATLPFLSEMATKYPWFTTAELSDMIAVSESTPGPMGVNMATYAGFSAGSSEYGFVGGVIGSLVATIGLILPSIIIIIIVARILTAFKDSKLVKDAFYTLRPAVCALITLAWTQIVRVCLIDIDAFQVSGNFFDMFELLPIIIFVVMFVAQRVFKKIHPIVFIAVAAVLGIILKL